MDTFFQRLVFLLTTLSPLFNGSLREHLLVNQLNEFIHHQTIIVSE